jgi:hypothetical protein
MPRTCWGERMFPHLSRYAEKTHRELFEESRRPVSIITPEKLEWYYQQFALAKRFSSDPKSRWEADGDGD